MRKWRRHLKQLQGPLSEETYTVWDMDKISLTKKGHWWRYFRCLNADKSSSSQPIGTSTRGKLLKSTRRRIYLYCLCCLSCTNPYGTCACTGYATPSLRHTQHTFKSVCFSVSYQANTLDLCTTEKELKCENIILLPTLMQRGGEYTGLHILGSTLSLDAI